MKNFNTNTDNNDVWLTPPSLIKSLGEFDLDPCSPLRRPWNTAKKHYNVNDNGLVLPWDGRVWLNPPYGRELALWLQKMSLHLNGTALIFGRTDTEALHKWMFPFAESILFIKGRLRFYTGEGIEASSSANAPSILISYTEYDAQMIEQSGIKGFHAYLKEMFVVQFEKDLSDGTWRVIVGEAFVDGKHKSIREICQDVLRIAPNKVKNNAHYRAKVRQVLQRYFKRVNKGVYAKA